MPSAHCKIPDASCELRTPLILWGASGHARVVADVVRILGKFTIVGFIDDIDPSKAGTIFCGATILGGRSKLAQHHENGVKHVLLAFGDCRGRVEAALFLKRLGFELPTAIHPRATVANDVSISEGTVVMAGAVINPGSHVGANVIVNTSSSVDHDCVIEDGVHVGPGVRLGGAVTLGRGAWLGIGAVVKDRVTVGAHAVIGAGSLVLGDIPGGVLAYGVPARVIRTVPT